MKTAHYHGRISTFPKAALKPKPKENKKADDFDLTNQNRTLAQTQCPCCAKIPCCE